MGANQRADTVSSYVATRHTLLCHANSVLPAEKSHHVVHAPTKYDSRNVRCRSKGGQQRPHKQAGLDVDEIFGRQVVPDA